MSGNRSRDNPIANMDTEGIYRPRSKPGSHSEQNNTGVLSGRHGLDDRRGDKWHKRPIPQAPGGFNIIVNGGSTCAGGGSGASVNHHGRKGHTHSNGHAHSHGHTHSHSHAQSSRQERNVVTKCLDIAPRGLDPMAALIKEETSASNYPPIVTIDGRVDTDLDHLLEDDDNDDDQDYDGPVEEPPSRYPRPHVFSVIHGSLDDDVDGYANDDGTMEHTLVDAPKSFHPRDLKDVASTDMPGSRVRPGQTKGGGVGRCSGRAAGGETASHMLSYSDRSHNKMHTESGEGERPTINSSLKQQDQQQQPQQRQPEVVTTPPPYPRIKTRALSRRQVSSEERINNARSRDGVSPTCVLSDSFSPRSTDRCERKSRGPTNSDASPEDARRRIGEGQGGPGGSKAQTVAQQYLVATNPLEGGAIPFMSSRIVHQASAGKSVSEQTQKSEEAERMKEIHRPMSCTPKRSRDNQPSGRSSLYSTPRRSATRTQRYSGGGESDSNDEDQNFITCRETMGSLTDRRISNSQLYRQRMSPGSRSPRRQVSNASSVSGLDSIGSESSSMCEGRCPRLEDKCYSDPPGRLEVPRQPDATNSKSDTKTTTRRVWNNMQNSSYRETEVWPSKRCCYKRTKEPVESKDAVEWYGNSPQGAQQTSPRAAVRSAKGNTPNDCEFFDAKDNILQMRSNVKDSKQYISEVIKEPKHIIETRRVSQGIYLPTFMKLLSPLSPTCLMGSRGDDKKQEEMPKLKYEYSSLLGREQMCRAESKSHKESKRQQLDNSVLQDIEESRPIQKAETTRHRYREENRRYSDTRRISDSPPRVKRRPEQYISRETDSSKYRHERWGNRRSSSSRRHYWHGSALAREGKDWSLDTGSIKSQMADLGASLLEMEDDPALAADHWAGTGRSWRRRRQKSSPRPDNTSRNLKHTKARRRSVRSREAKGKQQISPRASWSFGSDRSLVLQRKPKHMVPYRSKKQGDHGRKDLARIVGTSVDATDPSEIVKGFSVSNAIGEGGRADEDIKQSLEKAMAIARESLAAAARVSKALNLVMTSSCLSIESCSLYGSSADPRSPRFSLQPTASGQILRWHQAQNPSLSPRYADRTGAPLVANQAWARSRDIVSTRRSGTAVDPRDQVVDMTPAGQSFTRHSDSVDPSTPLVSIYIGTPGGQQQQVARIFSSHVQPSHPPTPSISDGGGFFTNSPRKQGSWAHNDASEKRRLQESGTKDPDKLCQYSADQKQQAYVNMVTTDSLNMKKFEVAKLSGSSTSQVFESTCETLREDPEWYNCEDKLPTNQQDVPTHEDGGTSRRPGRFSSPSRAAHLLAARGISSPLGITERVMSSFGCLSEKPGSPSRSTMLAVALDYLTAQPDRFSPPVGAGVSPGVVSTTQCVASPSSCVDPSGFLSDGSAVDPPTSRAGNNINENKTGREAMPSELKDGNKCYTANDGDKELYKGVITEPNSYKIRGSNKQESLHDGNLCTYEMRKTKDVSNLKKMSGKPQHNRHLHKNDLNGRTGRDGLGLANNKSKKARNEKFQTEVSLHESSQATDIPSGGTATQLTPDNTNNNSFSGRDVGSMASGLEGGGEQEEDFAYEEHASSSSGPDRNQNRPRLRRRGSPPKEQTLARALRIISEAEDKELSPNGDVLVEKSVREKHKVKKSLHVAMKLAEESLSAATRVTELLNKVVDVYQSRHPKVNIGLTKLKVPQYILLDNTSKRSRKALGVSEIQAIEYVEDAKLVEQSSINTDYSSQAGEGLTYEDLTKAKLVPVIVRQRSSSPRHHKKRSQLVYVQRDNDNAQGDKGSTEEPAREKVERGRENDEKARIIREYFKNRYVSPGDFNITREIRHDREGAQTYHDLESVDTSFNGESSRTQKYRIKMDSQYKERSAIDDGLYPYRGSKKENTSQTDDIVHHCITQSRDEENLKVNRRQDSPRKHKHKKQSSLAVNEGQVEDDVFSEISKVGDRDTKKERVFQRGEESPNNSRRHGEEKLTKHVKRKKDNETTTKARHYIPDERQNMHQSIDGFTSVSGGVIKGGHGNKKHRAASPTKLKRRAEDPREEGTSVDICKEDERKAKHSERTSSKTQSHSSKVWENEECAGPSSSQQCGSDFKPVKRRPRSPHKTRLSSKKSPLPPDAEVESYLHNISERERGLDPGCGDAAGKIKRSSKHGREKSQPLRDKVFSPQRPASPRKRRRRPEEERPRSSSVDDPAFYSTVTSAAMKFLANAHGHHDPANPGADGKNYSFNRTLDMTDSSIGYQCVPIKHKYPNSFGRAKQLMSNTERSRDFLSGKGDLQVSLEDKCMKKEPNLNAWSSSDWRGQDIGFEDDLAHSVQDKRNAECLSKNEPFQKPKCTNEERRWFEPKREENICREKNSRNTIANVDARYNSETTVRSGAGPEQSHQVNASDGSASSTSTFRLKDQQLTCQDFHQAQRFAKKSFLTETPIESNSRVMGKSSENPDPDQQYQLLSGRSGEQTKYLYGHNIDKGQWREKESWRPKESLSPSSVSSEEPDTRSSSQALTDHSSVSSPGRSETQRHQDGALSEMANQSRFQAYSRYSSSPEEQRNHGRAYAGLKRENSFHVADVPRDRWLRPEAGHQTLQNRHLVSVYSTVPSSATSDAASSPERPSNLGWPPARKDAMTSSEDETASSHYSFPSPDRQKRLMTLYGQVGERNTTQRPESSGERSLQSYTVSASTTEADSNISISETASPTAPMSSRFTDGVSAHQYLPVLNNGLEFGIGAPKAANPVKANSAPGEYNVSVSGSFVRTLVSDQEHMLSTKKQQEGNADTTNYTPVPTVDPFQTRPNGAGLYTLYRPLDNIRPGGFSPIIEESEISGFGMADCRSTSSLNRTCYGHENYTTTTNRSSLDVAQLPVSDEGYPAATHHNNGNINCSAALDNINNNASEHSVGSKAESDIRRPSRVLKKGSTPDLEQLLKEEEYWKQRMSHIRYSRSRSVEPVPFGKLNRLPLPPLKHPVPVKLAPPMAHMTEFQQWQLKCGNKSMCKRLINARKAGCTFDTGLKTPVKKPASSKLLTRITEQESITRENEKLFKKIINKESYYKRETLLKDYDKILPKLLSYAKYPEAIIKTHKINFI